MAKTLMAFLRTITTVFVLGLAAAAQGACLVNGVPVSGALETAPDSRYRVNPDGTVIDLRTRLMWKQCKQGYAGALYDVRCWCE